MINKDQNGMQCSEFEVLLPDALDEVEAEVENQDQGAAGVLSGEIRLAFQAHAASCPSCGPMFSEAREGMLWLRSLDEIDPPANLVHNILAVTSAAQAAAEPAKAQPGWVARFWKPARGVLAGALQPRFATSFSMAFFSLSLTLTLAGVKLKDVARFDWHPTAVSKVVMLQYTQVESKVVRYYNNLRLVYEIKSRVDELRKNADAEQKSQPAPEQPKKDKKKKDYNDTSSSPEQRQDNYSQEADDAVIACLTPSEEGANQ